MAASRSSLVYTSSVRRQQSLPTRRGELVYGNKYFTYVGDIRGSMPHGAGKLLLAGGADGVIEGTFVDGQLTCDAGKRSYADGSSYEGGFLDGEFHGHGVWQQPLPAAKQYSGSWAGNKFHGEGTLHWRDDAGLACVYTGDFHAHRQHGQGRLTRGDGCEYTGAFVDGFKSGNGVETTPDGFCYTGLFAVDTRHGLGRVAHATAPTEHVAYEGEWLRGVPAHSPSRMTIRVAAWRRPTQSTWPAGEGEILQVADAPVAAPAGKAAAGGKKPPSAGSVAGATGAKRPTQGGGKASTAAAPAAAAVTAATLEETAVPPRPLARLTALTLCAGSPVPAITVSLLWADAAVRVEVQQRRMEEAQARAIAEEEERRRKQEEEAAAAAAASKDKGKKSGDKAGSKAAATAFHVASEAAIADTGAVAQAGATEVKSDAEEWEMLATSESGRRLQLCAVRCVTERTAFMFSESDSSATKTPRIASGDVASRPGSAASSAASSVSAEEVLTPGTTAFATRLREGVLENILFFADESQRWVRAAGGEAGFPTLSIAKDAPEGQYALVVRDVTDPLPYGGPLSPVYVLLDVLPASVMPLGA